MRLLRRTYKSPDGNPTRISKLRSRGRLLPACVVTPCRILICLGFVLVFDLVALAQSTASIEGVITDQHGAIIPAAQISASSHSQGITRFTISDDLGRYQSPALQVGSYDLEVRATGFQTQIL